MSRRKRISTQAHREAVLAEFPEEFYTSEMLADSLDIPIIAVQASLEDLANAGFLVLKSKKGGEAEYIIPQDTIVEAVTYLSERRILPKRKREVPVNGEVYGPIPYESGKNRELLGQLFPLRERLRAIEQKTGISHDKIEKVYTFLKEHNYTSLTKPRALSLDDLERIIQEYRPAQEEFIRLRNAIIVQNMEQIRNIVGKIKKRLNGSASFLDFNDLLHESLIRVINAVEKYPAGCEAELTTYLYSTINNTIKNALNTKRRNVKVPWNLIRDGLKLEELEKRVKGYEGREMNDDDVAKEFGRPMPDWKEKIAQFRSTETPLEEEMLDPKYAKPVNPESLVSMEEIRTQVRCILSRTKLREKEAYTIEKRYFNDDNGQIYQEISRALGCRSKVTALRWERNAFIKLRRSEQLRELSKLVAEY